MARVESDSRAYQAAVALLAAGPSYWHGREFLTAVMDPVSASVTPVLLNVVVYWLADAYLTQAEAGRPLGSVQTGVCGLLATSVWISTAAAQTWPGALGRALAPMLFALFIILRVRLASVERRAERGHDEGLPLRLWLRHPIRTVRAWLWLGYRSAPVFRAASAEHDHYRDVRVAVRLAMPGLAHRTGRAVVLRELAAGRLTPAAAVAASGLLTRPGLPELHRAALVASLGNAPAATPRSPLPASVCGHLADSRDVRGSSRQSVSVSGGQEARVGQRRPTRRRSRQRARGVATPMREPSRALTSRRTTQAGLSSS